MGFPSTIKTFSSKTDNVDEIQAVDINEVQTEITAIETEFGTNPKGSAASVKARIEATETAIDAIENSAITALTGDVTASGPGSVATTIANKAVTLAKMADMATASLLGRNSSGIGAPEVLSKAIVKALLDLSGTNTGDQTITLTGDITGSGTGSFAATIANNAVTLAKMADMATASLLGRNTAGNGDPEVLSIATIKSMLGFPPGGVRLYRTDNYELTTSGTLYAIPFTHELRDDASYHNTSSNTSRITIPEAGWYLINGGLAYEANAIGVRDILFRVDGSSYIANQRMQACTDTNRGTDLSLTSLYYFTASQYVELIGRQYSGGALNVLANTYNSPVFAAIKIL